MVQIKSIEIDNVVLLQGLVASPCARAARFGFQELICAGPHGTIQSREVTLSQPCVTREEGAGNTLFDEVSAMHHSPGMRMAHLCEVVVLNDITQLKAQGPSRPCNKSKEEEKNVN